MFSSQADNLSVLALEKSGSDLLHISFEPFWMKKKNLKSLAIGDTFLIQDNMPMVYVLDGTDIVGQARLGQHDNCGEMIVVEATEHMMKKSSQSDKLMKLWPKFAVIPKDKFVVGNMVELSNGGHTSVVLYGTDGRVGIASIHASSKGYILQIDEVL